VINRVYEEQDPDDKFGFPEIGQVVLWFLLVLGMLSTFKGCHT
jgi:hypothetical protein